MKAKPLGDRVLVRRKTAEEKSKGGILLPPTAQEKEAIGTIVAKGPKAGDEIELGDTVIFGKYSGSEVKLSGQDLIVLKVDEIMVRYPEGETEEVDSE